VYLGGMSLKFFLHKEGFEKFVEPYPIRENIGYEKNFPPVEPSKNKELSF